MGGRPVWLASASLRDRHGRPLPTDRWAATRERDRVEKALMRAVRGVGDERRQRLFRMPVTLCLHRALTDEEVAGLPAADVTPQHLAGGSLEVLWETEPGEPSTRPCEAPTRRPVNPLRPDLYLPEDCGACDPCRARYALEG